MLHKRCICLFIFKVLAEQLTAKIHIQRITLGMYVQCLFKTTNQLHSFLKAKKKNIPWESEKKFLLSEGCTTKL